MFAARRSSVALWLPIVLIPFALGFTGDCGGNDAPERISSCRAPADWTPERIELLDMSDERLVGADGLVHIVEGSQGLDMVGFYVVVHGDDVPDCLETTIALNMEVQSGQWAYESWGDRRAKPNNPAYWTYGWDGSDVSLVSVTVGELTVDFDVIIVR